MTDMSIVLKLERDPCADNVILIRGDSTFVITGEEYRTLALMGMRADLDRAARAMAEGDVIKMMAAYESLKGWNT